MRLQHEVAGLDDMLVVKNANWQTYLDLMLDIVFAASVKRADRGKVPQIVIYAQTKMAGGEAVQLRRSCPRGLKPKRALKIASIRALLLDSCA
jgi:hypothetical protein